MVTISTYTLTYIIRNIALSFYSQNSATAVIIKILSLLQHLRLQIDLCEGICIACHTLFKDHMYTCQWSDTGPPGPLVKLSLFQGFSHNKPIRATIEIQTSSWLREREREREKKKQK